MVQQYVAPAQRLEDVDGRRRLDFGQPRVGGRYEGRDTSVRRGARSAIDVEPPQVERTRQPEHLVLGDVQLGDQQVEHGRSRSTPRPRGAPAGRSLRRRSSFSSAASRFSASSSSTSRSSLRVTRKVCTSSTSMPGKSSAEVGADDVLERDEAGVAQRHEAVEVRRHLHPREVLLGRLRVPDQNGEVEREPRDVGEGVGRVDRQRREHRVDALLEELLAPLLLFAVEVGPADQRDALVAQRRARSCRGGRVPAAG